MFTGVGSPSSILTGMYSRGGEFVSGINQVLSIKEGGVSILATVFVVCMILFLFYHEKE